MFDRKILLAAAILVAALLHPDVRSNKIGGSSISRGCITSSGSSVDNFSVAAAVPAVSSVDKSWWEQQFWWLHRSIRMFDRKILVAVATLAAARFIRMFGQQILDAAASLASSALSVGQSWWQQNLWGCSATSVSSVDKSRWEQQF